MSGFTAVTLLVYRGPSLIWPSQPPLETPSSHVYLQGRKVHLTELWRLGHGPKAISRRPLTGRGPVPSRPSLPLWPCLLDHHGVRTWIIHLLSLRVKSLSHVWLFATPWTVAYQAPPSMGFSRQECWSGLPFPSPGDLPDPGIEPGSPRLQADTLPSEPPGKP